MHKLYLLFDHDKDRMYRCIIKGPTLVLPRLFCPLQEQNRCAGCIYIGQRVSDAGANPDGKYFCTSSFETSIEKWCVYEVNLDVIKSLRKRRPDQIRSILSKDLPKEEMIIALLEVVSK